MINEVKKTFMGAKLTWIKRHCDLIMLDFRLADGSNGFIHGSCFFKVMLNGNLIISSYDMMIRGRKKGKKEFSWDEPGTSLFDDCVNDYIEFISKLYVANVQLENNELTILFNNELVMQFIPDSVDKEIEHYRIATKAKELLVI